MKKVEKLVKSIQDFVIVNPHVVNEKVKIQ